MKKLVWVYGGPSQEFLVAEDGRILAKILRLGFMGPWLYKDAEYIDLESAKRVAEKDIGVPA